MLPSTALSGLLTIQPATAPAVAAAAGIDQAGAASRNCAAPGGSSATARSSQGVNHSQPSQAPMSGKDRRGNGGADPLSRGRSSSAVNAGLSVNELNAEMSVLTAIVRANCRKNCPVIPA